MKIIVDQCNSNKTVKDLLFSDLSLSRGQVVSLKKNGGIRVNSQHVTVRYVLCKGDVLELDLEDREEDVNSAIEPVFHELSVLYEDDDVICVDKPAGMATHPSHNHHGDTLANALAYYYHEKNIPFVFRAVNRLDRETSGVVLVAKNRAAASKLSESMQNGLFEKRYIAVVCGSPELPKGSINAYIKRREDSIIFRKAEDFGSSSESALTNYEVLETDGVYSIIEARPITGRTHQIRVHFAYIGIPIYGDGLYGTQSAEGLMLHASSLRFPLPSGKEITVIAQMPKRFNMFRRKNEI